MIEYVQVKTRKTMIPASHAGNTGSIPVGTTTSKIKALGRFQGPFLLGLNFHSPHYSPHFGSFSRYTQVCFFEAISACPTFSRSESNQGGGS